MEKFNREQQNERVLTTISDTLDSLNGRLLSDSNYNRVINSLVVTLLSDISKSLAIIADKVNEENDCLHGGDK